MSNQPPIAISYRPKKDNYLPVVVASIRRHLGDWPIVLLTEEKHLPPENWLRNNDVNAITGWEHSQDANKVLRLWEHQEIFSRHFERWIWWHDDMVLLRPLEDPEAEFSRPLVAQGERKRPNKELSNWRGWLWDTLGFFRCLNIPAPNPVLHIPRVIEREMLVSIPAEWNRQRLLFEPTYLLWRWHQLGITAEIAEDYRCSEFKDKIPSIFELEAAGFTILNWGKKINHESAHAEFGELYPLTFSLFVGGNYINQRSRGQ